MDLKIEAFPIRQWKSSPQNSLTADVLAGHVAVVMAPNLNEYSSTAVDMDP
jgi:hypothetical protein